MAGYLRTICYNEPHMSGQASMSDEAAVRRRDVGRRVARWRKRRGLTRQQFADLCGRSPSWVDKIESGERALLRLPMLERVAEVLKVATDELTCGAGARVATAGLDAFDISAVREALQRYDAITSVFVTVSATDTPPDLAEVGRQVIYAWSSFQNGRYSVLGRILPGLLRQAQDALADAAAEDKACVQTVLSRAYQVTASTLWKMKEIDLAWLAAERGLVLAEQIGDSLLISDAARRVAQGLMATNLGDQALRLLRADMDRLEPGLGTASPEYLSLYGMLFLLGGVVAARAGQAAVASELLGEGQAVAARLGGDRNERFTAFGPTNVLLHQVATLVDLREGGAAVQVAKQVTPDGLAGLPRERRATFFIDIACGHAQESQRDQAVAALLEAEQLAPDEVRCRPLAVSLVDDLQQRGPGRPPLALRQLAARVGLRSRS